MKLRRFEHEIVIRIDRAEVDLSVEDLETWAERRAANVMDDALLAVPAQIEFRLFKWIGETPVAEGSVHVRVYRDPGNSSNCFEAKTRPPLDIMGITF